MRKILISTGALVLAAMVQLGCGGIGADEGTPSEVAASVVSGALNNSSGSALGMNELKERPSPAKRFLEAIQPIGSAWAATWSCSGGTLTPTFAGAAGNPYSYAPVSCMVDWENGKTASSSWSGVFTFNYGAACDSTHPWMENQTAACSLTRTTAAGGNTRTITGPNGNTYAVTHDTNGAGTGWDSTVTPAPNDSGVVVTCAAGGCTAGKTLVIGGSNLVATSTKSGTAKAIWNHTVTAQSGLTVTGEGTGRVVSGDVTVQHNLAKYTATATFNSVGFGEAGCCFPTSGNITTVFSNGSNQGKTETLAFSTTCGEATMTTPSGNTVSLTLQHCL